LVGIIGSFETLHRFDVTKLKLKIRHDQILTLEWMVCSNSQVQPSSTATLEFGCERPVQPAREFLWSDQHEFISILECFKFGL
jgi:hypothetical protein